MVTTLYLIRHGETEGSGVKRYKGSIDVPLSENGQRQIEQVAEYVVQGLSRSNGSNSLNAIYCSPLSRAVKSAEIIAAPHGLKPIVIKELRERSFGIWEGMSFTGIKEQYPEEFNAWANNPLKYSPVDGENTLELKDRVIETLEKILNNHKGTVPDLRTKQGEVVESGLSPEINIAIVAHGGVNRVILCHIMGIPLENIFRLEQDFAAINIIEFHDNFPVVKLLNGGCIG